MNVNDTVYIRMRPIGRFAIQVSREALESLQRRSDAIKERLK